MVDVSTSKDPAAKVLEAALAVVTGARRKSYGNPEDNFGVIANLWNRYLNERRKRSEDISAELLQWRVDHPDDPPPFGHQRPFLSRGNIRIDTIDVAILMALMKVARLIESPGHEDSWTDLAGYAACGARCAIAEGCAPNVSEDEQPPNGKGDVTP
jgi:hypothetical protein